MYHTGAYRALLAGAYRALLNQPIWKIWVKLEIFPKIGIKIKNIWNHHLEISTATCWGEWMLDQLIQAVTYFIPYLEVT